MKRKRTPNRSSKNKPKAPYMCVQVNFQDSRGII